MSPNIEVKEGQNFQDGTGLTVKVGEIDSHDRVHFSVSKIEKSMDQAKCHILPSSTALQELNQ